LKPSGKATLRRLVSVMCYTSRDYRAEQEARKAREEARRQQEAREVRRPEKTEALKEREREVVRA
jgi:hypothetical protein